MRIFRISEIDTTEQPKQVAYVFSLDMFVAKMGEIKNAQMNVVSIRDHIEDQNDRNKRLYKAIDNAGFANIYIANFDDLETDSEEASFPYKFPKKDQVHDVLRWADAKWKENGKPFAIHCTGGVSRSSALAILINQMIQNNYTNVFDPKYHSPNKKIMEYGEEYINTQGISEEVANRVKEYDAQNRELF